MLRCMLVSLSHSLLFHSTIICPWVMVQKVYLTRQDNYLVIKFLKSLYCCFFWWWTTACAYYRLTNCCTALIVLFYLFCSFNIKLSDSFWHVWVNSKKLRFSCDSASSPNPIVNFMCVSWESMTDKATTYFKVAYDTCFYQLISDHSHARGYRPTASFLVTHCRAPTGPAWALGWCSCSACISVWSRVKVALRMNKMYSQVHLSLQTHMHRFKGTHAENEFLQHTESVRKAITHHTQLNVPLMSGFYKTLCNLTQHVNIFQA